MNLTIRRLPAFGGMGPEFTHYIEFLDIFNNNDGMAYKILIVDDNKEERDKNRSVFAARGFDVIEAEDGAKGLDAALEKKPDIILTGIVMPKMDGFDMIGQLKKNVNTADIPVMIYSHMGRKEDQLKAQGMGIKDFITAGFVSPKEIIRLALFRIEGDKGEKNYLLKVDETAADAAKLTKDFGLPPYLECEKHPDEKMMLSVSPNPEHSGEFRAKFVCPKEAGGNG